MHLVIYGDFNCPFSALASDRAAPDWSKRERPASTGAPSNTHPYISLTGDDAAWTEEVDRELEQVYALLVTARIST